MKHNSTRAKTLTPIDAEVRDWMRRLGFVHESEIEDASCTTHRFRKNCPLRPIRFGLENWYSLDDIQQYLKSETAKAHQNVEEVSP